MKELDERLGVRLLSRTTRKVSLTETGRAYYERCTRRWPISRYEQAVTDMHAAPRGEFARRCRAEFLHIAAVARNCGSAAVSE